MPKRYKVFKDLPGWGVKHGWFGKPFYFSSWEVALATAHYFAQKQAEDEKKKDQTLRQNMLRSQRAVTSLDKALAPTGRPTLRERLRNVQKQLDTLRKSPMFDKIWMGTFAIILITAMARFAIYTTWSNGIGLVVTAFIFLIICQVAYYRTMTEISRNIVRYQVAEKHEKEEAEASTLDDPIEGN